MEPPNVVLKLLPHPYVKSSSVKMPRRRASDRWRDAADTPDSARAAQRRDDEDKAVDSAPRWQAAAAAAAASAADAAAARSVLRGAAHAPLRRLR